MEFAESPSHKTIYTASILLIAVAVGILAAILGTRLLLLISVIPVLGLVLVLLYRPTIALYVLLFFWPIYPIVNKMLPSGPINLVLRLWQEEILLLAVLGIALRLCITKSRVLRFKSLDWIV